MCQMSVVVEDEKGERVIMKNVSELSVSSVGVQLNRMFERPIEVKDVVITKIDFLGGKVYLSSTEK